MDAPARRPLGFVAAGIGGGLGSAIGGWVAYLFLPGAPWFIGGWAGGVIGVMLGVGSGGHAGVLLSGLGIIPAWPLVAWLGSLPLVWIVGLLTNDLGLRGSQVLLTAMGLWGGGLAGVVGRAISWGVGGAIVGFPEDDVP